MFIEEVKHYLDRTMKYAYLDTVQHDGSLKKKSCICEFFVKEIDEKTVEATVNSGYGHDIVLLFTSKDCQMLVSVKHIAYFGDLLNIVNLRRHGFYDDNDLLTSAHYDGNSYEFFKTHAKKYANASSEFNECMADSVKNAVNVGMKNLIKKGLSNDALRKKQQHAQDVADNKTFYKVLKLNHDTTVQSAIRSVIDESHKNLILVKSYNNVDSIMTDDALYVDPYDGKSYSRLELTDEVVSNPDNNDKNLISVAKGISLRYVMHLDTSTQEMTVVDKIMCRVEYELSRVNYGAFKNVKYVKNVDFEYDIRQEVLDACPFMSYDIEDVSIEQVKELVKAFTKSVDRVNRLIAYTTDVAID